MVAVRGKSGSSAPRCGPVSAFIPYHFGLLFPGAAEPQPNREKAIDPIRISSCPKGLCNLAQGCGVGRVRRVSFVTRQKNGLQNVGLRHFGLIAEMPNPTYALS
uniref:Uncharacterized protein n=1 Tax=Candidatus Kentrum sp. DK TaxID=2126562 RepID=A0A450S9C9_9GAMM|nr:MAG: hypothetical protein BECKDK2373C_GA0170839_102221 [Candidatus Kentron sp. DK]